MAATLCFIPVLLFLFENTVFAALSVSIRSSITTHEKQKNYRPAISPYMESGWKKNGKKNSPLHTLFNPPPTQSSAAADNSKELTSNAYNFHGAWNASVNPRTGSASFSLIITNMLYDNGRAKHSLILSYNGSSFKGSSDSFGLGSNWSFNVGVEHPQSDEIMGHKKTNIITGDGHLFTMVTDRNQQGKTYWHPLWHKLGDVIFFGHPGDWIISKSTDVRERIVNGYAQWEQARDGRKLYFYYDRNGAGDKTRKLTYICGNQLTLTEQKKNINACKENGIWISYQGNQITIHGNQVIVLHKGSNHGVTNIHAITMPSLSSPGINGSSKDAVIKFSYDAKGNRPWLLSRVQYPDGKNKSFLYNEESDRPQAQIQGLPVGTRGMHIPVVTEVITSSEKPDTTGSSVFKEWYYYGEPNNSGKLHNYMGYQNTGNIEPGIDNLFNRPSNYTYSVSRDNGLTTTTTTYNKYHLPLLVEQRENKKNSVIAKSTHEYTPWRNTVFAELPDNYSLPVKTEKALYAITENGQEKQITSAKIIQEKHYDSNGNTIWHKDAYNRITMTQYCPPQGNLHCPPMDSRWPKVNLPEKILTIPAPEPPQNSLSMLAVRDAEPVLETIFDYQALPVTSRYLPSSGGNHIGMPDEDHFWQVKTKTTGTLPVSAVKDLKPGNDLPELSQDKISTQTNYRYNTQKEAETYGQLNQLTVFSQHYNHIPVKISKFIKTRGTESDTSEKIIVSIHQIIDKEAETRTVTTTMTSNLPTGSNILTHMKDFYAENNDISLGTTVYSLKTGAKLSNYDTLKEMQSKWYYDVWGRLVKKVVMPSTGGKPQTTRWYYSFDYYKSSVTEILPGGQQLKKVFNSFNQVVSTWHRFSNTKKSGITGITNWIPDTKITYTSAGKPARKTVYHSDDSDINKVSGRTVELTTSYGYDILNRLVWKKTPDGIISITARNDPEMQIIHYSVSTASDKPQLSPMLTIIKSNVLGKPVARYLLPLDPYVKKNNKLLYPPYLQKKLLHMARNLSSGNSLQSQNSYGSLIVSGPDGLLSFVKKAIGSKSWLTHTVWRYDGHGRLKTKEKGNGAATYWMYHKDIPVKIITPDGRAIYDKIDIHGKKTFRCIQPKGSDICHVMGTRKFDMQGNMIWQANEYGQALHYTWDANGRMLSMQTPGSNETPAGHIFTFQYNSLGLTKGIIDGHAYVFNRYDPITWKLIDTNDPISHLHYTYDETTGTLIKITRSHPLKENGIIPLQDINYPDSAQKLTHDHYLHPVSITDESGNRYTSLHDKVGRVVQTKIQINYDKLNTNSPEKILTTTSYDNFSRPASITNGNKIKRIFNYNTLGQVASTVDIQNKKTLLKLSYTYDNDTNNILTITREEGDLSVIQSYTYDLQNNLTSFSCNNKYTDNKNGTDSINICPRDTDIKNSELSIPPIITHQQYTFDQWNNIHQVIENISTEKGPMTKTVSYNYSTAGDAKNMEAYDSSRLLSYQTKWQGKTTKITTSVLTYDSQGRIIKNVDGDFLHYNAFGQMNRFTNSETGDTTVYAYDSEGHQMVKQIFDINNKPLQSPLYIFYRGDSMVSEAQKGKDNQLHISSELSRVAHSEDGIITHWYLRNYKGDVLQTYNIKNELQNSNIYSPYGMQYNIKTVKSQEILQNLKTKTPIWKKYLPGFDGQMTDLSTGYQFLGNGYRAYNPVYRHFMVKDNFSPFKKLNGYEFCDNNPIINIDPTGHAPRWLGYALTSFGIGVSIVMAVLLPVIGAAVSEASLTTGAIVGSMGGGMGIASGSLQITAMQHPENMMLQNMSNAFGIADGISGMAMGTVGFTEGIISSFNAVSGIEKLSAALLIFSGISGETSGMINTASSGMSTVTNDTRQSNGNILQATLRALSYLSMGLSLFSIASEKAAINLSSICQRDTKDMMDNQVTTTVNHSMIEKLTGEPADNQYKNTQYGKDYHVAKDEKAYATNKQEYINDLRYRQDMQSLGITGNSTDLMIKGKIKMTHQETNELSKDFASDFQVLEGIGDGTLIIDSTTPDLKSNFSSREHFSNSNQY